MASVPIRSTAVDAAPKDYSIPSAQQIRLLSVHAAFDGSGSGAAWLPAVQILDNNGNVLVTAADPNVSVAAGGSADVSWFPGVKPQATGTTPSGTAIPWGFLDRSNVAALASGVTTTIQMNPALADASSGSSADGDITFGASAGNYGFQFNTNGIFLCFGQADLSINVAPAANSGANMQMVGGNFVVAGARDIPWLANPAVGGNYRCEPSGVWIVNLPSASFTPPVVRTVTVNQASGAATASAIASFFALRLDDVGSTSF